MDTIERYTPSPSEPEDAAPHHGDATDAHQREADAGVVGQPPAGHDARVVDAAPPVGEPVGAPTTEALDPDATLDGDRAHDGHAAANGHADPLSDAPGDALSAAPVNWHANGHSNGHSNGHAALPPGERALPAPYPSAAQTYSRARVASAQARRRRKRYAHYVLRTSRARHQQRARTLSRALWGSAIVLFALIVAVLTSTVSAAASYYQSQTAVLGSLNRKIAAQDSVRIYDARGTLLYQLNDFGAQHSVALAHVPVSVINATIAVEDKDFWTNQGVDFQAIARAAYSNATSGQIQSGASTITQQLIKQNVLNSDPTFTRKIEEAILSLGMTTQGTFTKRQILEMYLNSIPYGPISYGIDAAASRYFSYSDDPATGITAAQHLDLAQASILAGIPQSPNVNDPLGGPDGFAHARQRQHLVLADMVTQGYITQAQADAAWQEAGQPNFFHPQFDE
ncbi:MAG TPA: transglycosylase domain-containing protein, partial [Ktedonobacterales bacterium]